MAKRKTKQQGATWMEGNSIDLMSKFSFDEFNEDKWEWEEYISQFERMCRIKGLGGEGDKLDLIRKDLLLAYVGPKALRAIRNYLVDSDVDNKPYQDLKLAFKKIFKPKTTIFAARFAFERASRGDGESFNQFANRLRGLAIPCKYGPSVKERLRDRFAVGINCNRFEVEIRQRWPDGQDEEGKEVTFERI